MTSLKEQAITLRKKGYSYALISLKLGIAKSTLSSWLRNIPFEPNTEVKKRIDKARIKSAKYKNREKLKSIKKAEKKAKLDIGKLSKRDLWMLGIGLYLGEGSKLYEITRIINSDPKIINLAIKWFKDVCSVPSENFSIAIHIYPDTNQQKAVNFWKKTTGIPLKQFEKIQIDKRKNKSIKKRNKLPYGTAHLNIRSRGNKKYGVYLHRRILAWINYILE